MTGCGKLARVLFTLESKSMVESGALASDTTMGAASTGVVLVAMGGTEFSDVAVHEILTRCIPQWPGRSYHLLKRNCCHFANFLCEALKVGAVPDYVMNLASAGASIASGLDTSAEVVRGMAAAVDERYQITNSIEGFVPREIEVDEEAIETMIRNFWKSLGWTR